MTTPVQNRQRIGLRCCDQFVCWYVLIVGMCKREVTRSVYYRGNTVLIEVCRVASPYKCLELSMASSNSLMRGGYCFAYRMALVNLSWRSQILSTLSLTTSYLHPSSNRKYLDTARSSSYAVGVSVAVGVLVICLRTYQQQETASPRRQRYKYFLRTGGPTHFMALIAVDEGTLQTLYFSNLSWQILGSMCARSAIKLNSMRL